MTSKGISNAATEQHEVGFSFFPILTSDKVEMGNDECRKEEGPRMSRKIGGRIVFLMNTIKQRSWKRRFWAEVIPIKPSFWLIMILIL